MKQTFLEGESPTLNQLDTTFNCFCLISYIKCKKFLLQLIPTFNL